MFHFESQPLLDAAQKLSQSYKDADPFPSIVIDEFMSAQVLAEILEEIKAISDESWMGRQHQRSNKFGIYNMECLGNKTRHLFQELNSAPMIRFLECLTGIEGLVPDPHFEGAGVSRSDEGGMLKIHADFNFNQVLKLDRRVNLLLYLNHDWQDNYGGHLQMWNRSMTECVKKIAPIFNRLVVLSTDSYSYHGHPDPMTPPPGVSRYALSVYYYSNGRPASEGSQHHDSLYKERPRRYPGRLIQLLIPQMLNEIGRYLSRTGFKGFIIKIMPPPALQHLFKVERAQVITARHVGAIEL